MGREVQAAGIEVVAHGGQDQPAELELTSRVVGTCEHRVVNRNRGVGYLLELWHQPLP